MTAVPFSSDRTDPNQVGHDRSNRPRHAAGRTDAGPAPKRIVVGYGFWIFLLSDIVMFAAFFATYAVLVGETAGGPTGSQLFDLRNVAACSRPALLVVLPALPSAYAINCGSTWRWP